MARELQEPPDATRQEVTGLDVTQLCFPLCAVKAL